MKECSTNSHVFLCGHIETWTFGDWVLSFAIALVMISLIMFVVYHVRMWAKELGDPFSHISKEPEAIRGQVLDVIPEALTLETLPDRVT